MNDLVSAVIDSLHMAGLVEIEVSGKHVHLTQEACEILFGKGMGLIPKRDLSQPGQFLSDQRVNLIGPKGSMKRVAVLGPCRKANQVELSKSDCVALGIDAPIRESGDLEGSAAITIEGPCGRIDLRQGAIIAHNHIHVTEKDSELLNLRDGERVAVEVLSDRPVIFEDVVIRVSSRYSCKMHIDFDEANAASVHGFTLGRIIRKLERTGIGRGTNWNTTAI